MLALTVELLKQRGRELLPEYVTGTGDERSLRAIAEDVGFAPMSGLVGEAAAGSWAGQAGRVVDKIPMIG